PAQIAIPRKLGERCRATTRGAGLDDEAGFMMAVHPRHSRRQVRADHGLAASHRFELYDAERFRTRNGRQHEDVARVEVGDDVLIAEMSQKVNTRTSTVLERRTHRSVTHDQGGA